jgi:hypothetical protein
MAHCREDSCDPRLPTRRSIYLRLLLTLSVSVIQAPWTESKEAVIFEQFGQLAGVTAYLHVHIELSISSVEQQLSKYRQLLVTKLGKEESIRNFMLGQFTPTPKPGTTTPKPEYLGNFTNSAAATIRANSLLWQKIASLHLRDVDDIEHHISLSGTRCHQSPAEIKIRFTSRARLFLHGLMLSSCWSIPIPTPTTICCLLLRMKAAVTLPEVLTRTTPTVNRKMVRRLTQVPSPAPPPKPDPPRKPSYTVERREIQTPTCCSSASRSPKKLLTKWFPSESDAGFWGPWPCPWPSPPLRWASSTGPRSSLSVANCSNRRKPPGVYLRWFRTFPRTSWAYRTASTRFAACCSPWFWPIPPCWTPA